MSNQEDISTETKIVENKSDINVSDEKQSSDKIEKVEKLSSSDLKTPNDTTTSNRQEPTHRITMPQDIRYSTEQSDRDKITQKYQNYQVSDTNSCHVRFLTDHRQKKSLLDRTEDDHSNLHSMSKMFSVDVLPGYQNPTKNSFKVYGTEANVRKCLIEIINRMFKQTSHTPPEGATENHGSQTTSGNDEKSVGKEISNDNEKSLPSATSIFITTINPDSSITEEKKPISATTVSNNGTNEEKAENSEQEQLKYVRLERKPLYTFTILITGQGQEVLKKNWNFFAGSLQQRLNVTVANPFKLPKFGDKQWQNELLITGESFENIIDAVLQLIAFINEVLGIRIQPYKVDDEQTNTDYNNHQTTRNTNNDYHQQRRHEHNNNYRQSSSQYQGQTSSNTYHERTFFNRGRNGIFEQTLLIRSNCVARIVGTRASNLKRIQSKCHLRDIIVARQPNENGYVECKLSAYQIRNLNFAVDTIRSYLRNEDDQAVQVLDSNYVDNGSQSSSSQTNSLQQDETQSLLANQENAQEKSLSTIENTETRNLNREKGFMTRPLHLNNGTPVITPSYNFQNTPSFDFTHRATSASRKTDKRPGEVNDCSNTSNGHSRTLNDYQYQQYGSSSSNSSSVSPRHKSKRTCPETKEIDCTTDEGFWIQKQFYYALDDASKDLFDSLLDKLEKIRIAYDENAARKQQRLIGRNRPNKSRTYPSSISSTKQSNDEKDSGKQTKNTKIEEESNTIEQKDECHSNLNEQKVDTVITVDQK